MSTYVLYNKDMAWSTIRFTEEIKGVISVVYLETDRKEKEQKYHVNKDAAKIWQDLTGLHGYKRIA